MLHGENECLGYCVMTSTALGNGTRAGSRAAGRQVPVQKASEGVRSPEDPAVGEIGSPGPGPRLGVGRFVFWAEQRTA